jgi:hypothetical protein
MAETEESENIRKLWMQHGSKYEGPCTCLNMTRTRDMYDRLKHIARYMKRVESNVPATNPLDTKKRQAEPGKYKFEEGLNDAIDDLWA